ncbi:MAG: right-handed parallel beta-helix repeat-containing protein [Actinomycetota bacterium]|nr:right-handed parallel beta-helix repeat-containing protein [Actinomycetota bacterium]
MRLSNAKRLGIPALRRTALAAVAGSFIAFGAGPAAASHVSCGDEITADTTLDSDLVNCPDNGLVIAADDITLNLNGHRVDGDGELFEPCPDGEFCDVGLLNDGHDGVTVRDGTAREFALGAFVGKARRNRVLGITSTKNLFFGFVVAESARSVVRDNSGDDNLAPDGDGMGLFGSHDIRIVDNSFQHNPLGLHVEDSTDNLIKGNLFSRNDLGILMEADRNQVRRNRSVRDGGGILMFGSRNAIGRNRFSRSQDAIGIERGRGNLVARNVVIDPRRVGIRLGLQRPEQVGGAENVVRRNLVRGSAGDGFVVYEKDNRSRLTRNVATGSRDDGFDVESRSAKLTGNRAFRNGDLGIEARIGVIDGGGNRARANGDSRQCKHISCR